MTDSNVVLPQGDYRWSKPAERNKEPILVHLQRLLAPPRKWRVLEIGSGTGQHALHFTRCMPNLEWFTSDLIANHETINALLDAAGNASVHRPVELSASTLDSYEQPIDVIYTANTCHIMSWTQVKAMLRNAGKLLPIGGLLIIYGPFHVGGQATSEGNYRFDQSLSMVNPWQGIRDREHVVLQADGAGFSLIEWHDMPATNQLLVLERRRDNRPMS